jgi:hypothetical protein
MDESTRRATVRAARARRKIDKRQKGEIEVSRRDDKEGKRGASEARGDEERCEAQS